MFVDIDRLTIPRGPVVPERSNHIYCTLSRNRSASNLG